MCLSVTNHVNYSCELYHVKRYNGHVFVNLFLAFCENVWKKSSYIYLIFYISKNTFKPGSLSIYNKNKYLSFFGIHNKKCYHDEIKERSNIHVLL